MRWMVKSGERRRVYTETGEVKGEELRGGGGDEGLLTDNRKKKEKYSTSNV